VTVVVQPAYDRPDHLSAHCALLVVDGQRLGRWVNWARWIRHEALLERDS
jgi:hypothetical protein